MQREIKFSGGVSQIYLIGMMGAGKSTAGRILAEKLDWSFVDTDDMVEARGMSVSEIFKTKGEEAFRQIEREVLISCARMDRVVIAAGGGLPCFHDNLNDMLSSGLVVYLQASVKTLFGRIKADSNDRPLISTNANTRNDNFKTLLQERKSCYERAHFTIDTDEWDISAIVAKIQGIIPDELMR